MASFVIYLISVVRIMLKFICLLSLLWWAEADSPTVDESKQIVELLTKIRKEVNPTASNMMLMEYSDELENLAKTWLNNCTYPLPHGPAYPEYKDVVDVLQTGSSKANASFDLSALFDSEKNAYNYENNTCNSSCANYRRMVWSTATHVGCYRQYCARSSNWSDSTYIMACLYRPVVLNDQEKPYKNGTPCSACPYGPDCNHNQCTQKQMPTTSTTSTPSSSSSISTGPSSSTGSLEPTNSEQPTTSVSTQLPAFSHLIFAFITSALYINLSS
uniref:SCP domain-containing protein n=1 Tax=Mesocestoides corti TaxID=53468 RepID=A0A5K3F8I7_MESCO